MDGNTLIRTGVVKNTTLGCVNPRPGLRNLGHIFLATLYVSKVIRVNLNLCLHHFVVAPVVVFVFVPAGVVSPLVLVILSPIFGIFCARLNWEDSVTLSQNAPENSCKHSQFPCQFPECFLNIISSPAFHDHCMINSFANSLTYL